MRINGRYFRIFGEDSGGKYEYIIKGIKNDGKHGKYLYVRGRVLHCFNVKITDMGRTYVFCVSPKLTDIEEINKEDIYLYIL